MSCKLLCDWGRTLFHCFPLLSLSTLSQTLHFDVHARRVCFNNQAPTWVLVPNSENKLWRCQRIQPLVKENAFISPAGNTVWNRQGFNISHQGNILLQWLEAFCWLPTTLSPPSFGGDYRENVSWRHHSWCKRETQESKKESRHPPRNNCQIWWTCLYHSMVKHQILKDNFEPC